MIVDIPTKDMVKKMVDMKVRKEMTRVYQILDKFRTQLIDVEEKVNDEKRGAKSKVYGKH
jgi:hypothetical protein